MNKSAFNFTLPEELIAQYPSPERRGSRLLVVNGDSLSHRQFVDFPQFVTPGDLLVFNNTKVIPARLLGYKSTGGHVEVLVERVINDTEVLAHVRASKSPKPGMELLLENHVRLEVLARHDDLFRLRSCDGQPILPLLEQYGHMPLPPYITRADEGFDQERYQTVYAREPGAVAAPTAGLHFDEAMLSHLQAQGVQTGFVTLHVGAGTFQPVRVDDIRQHKMHAEAITVSETLCEQVRNTKAAGKRVIAVGTTSVRCLETASRDGAIKPYCGDTDIFIYPGYRFRCVDALLTNFHLPESTLLMLVSAFAGYDNIRRAYAAAIAEKYRFFSYGDAMFIAAPLIEDNHDAV